MATVSISGNSYIVYATVAEADSYLIPDLNYSIWSALSTDEKAAKLVQATRVIDAQSYIDSALTQTLRLAIDDFKIICILIASSVASGNEEILGISNPEQDVDVIKAGSVEINYFRDFTTFGRTLFVTRWTPNIYALISKYLDGQLSTFGFSNGTSGETTIYDYGVHF